jgi:hypothetical protein
MFAYLLGTILSLSNFSYANSPEIPVGPDEVFVTTTASDELKVMSWNVLNLFDAEKDLFSDDWLWLPKDYPGKQKYCSQIQDKKERDYCSSFDWTQEKVDLKLEQIRKVVSYQGSLPDMMAVEEIENENVVKMLAKKLGFQNEIVTASADKRGIDVGLMFNTNANFKLLGSKFIYVALPTGRPGRDILRVDFSWFDKPISIYINHWPSQFNPTEERTAFANVLKRDIDLMQTQNPVWSAFAVGDFNTTDKDIPNPFDSVLYDKSWKNVLVNGALLGRSSSTNPSISFSPPGSYFYAKEDSWSDFDRLLLTKNLVDGNSIEFNPDSLRLPFPMFMSKWIKLFNPLENGSSANRKVRVPFRYNFDTNDEAQRGFSDHVPMIFKLKKVN